MGLVGFGSNATEMACSCDLCFPLENDRPADIPERQLHANIGRDGNGSGSSDANPHCMSHQFIVVATSLSNSGSSKVLAVMRAPTATMSSWLRLVRIPIVAIPAAEAD